MISSNTAATTNPKKIAFAALHHKDFRAYFFATMLAMMADNIEHVISYWLLYEKFKSPVLAGFAVLSHWTPFLLFAVYFGALADRFDCRKVIQLAQIMYMGVSAAWAALFFTDTIQVWHACMLLLIHGMAGVLWGPGSQLLIHDIVGTDQLQSAVRLNSTSRQLGVLFGPAVGGGLMLLLSPSMGLIVNTLIYLPLTIWLLTVPYTGHSREGAAPARRALGWRDAFEVVREVSGNRPIMTMVVLAGCVSFFVGTAFQATMPEFAHDLGTQKADFAYSALLGANAAGAVIGGFLLRGPGLAAAACADRDDQRGSVVRRDHELRAVAELLPFARATFRSRHFEPDIFLDGADHRAATLAASIARPSDWLVCDGEHGPESLQWFDGGGFGRVDRGALVIGGERDGAVDRHVGLVCFRSTSATTRRI